MKNSLVLVLLIGLLASNNKYKTKEINIINDEWFFFIAKWITID